MKKIMLFTLLCTVFAFWHWKNPSQKQKNDKITLARKNAVKNNTRKLSSNDNASKVIAKRQLVLPRPVGKKYKQGKQQKTVSFNYTDMEVDHSLADGEYSLYKNVYAIDEDDFQAGSYEVLERKDGMVFIKASSRPVNSLEVVQVAGSNSPGVFSGVVKVKLSDIEMRDSVFPYHDFNVLEVHPDINYVFYEFKDFKEAISARKFLARNTSSLVKNVDIEVLKGRRQIR